MNYFPNNDEEINLVKFIAKFQYLSVNDTKYFFSTQKYYRARITSLVKKKYLRRIKSTLVLDEIGIEYCKLFNFEYTQLNRNQKYLSRLLYISNLGAYYNSSKNILFTPSFAIKDKEMFTVTARKFIGVFDISGIEYLAYYISQDRDNKYIKSVIYDIQKEAMLQVGSYSTALYEGFALKVPTLIIEPMFGSVETIDILKDINRGVYFIDKPSDVLNYLSKNDITPLDKDIDRLWKSNSKNVR